MADLGLESWLLDRSFQSFSITMCSPNRPSRTLWATLDSFLGSTFLLAHTSSTQCPLSLGSMATGHLESFPFHCYLYCPLHWTRDKSLQNLSSGLSPNLHGLSWCRLACFGASPRPAKTKKVFPEIKLRIAKKQSFYLRVNSLEKPVSLLIWLWAKYNFSTK